MKKKRHIATSAICLEVTGDILMTGEDKEKRPRGETFAQRLKNIGESDFKRAYVANVRGNQVNKIFSCLY